MSCAAMVVKIGVYQKRTWLKDSGIIRVIGEKTEYRESRAVEIPVMCRAYKPVLLNQLVVVYVA